MIIVGTFTREIFQPKWCIHECSSISWDLFISETNFSSITRWIVTVDDHWIIDQSYNQSQTSWNQSKTSWMSSVRTKVIGMTKDICFYIIWIFQKLPFFKLISSLCYNDYQEVKNLKDLYIFYLISRSQLPFSADGYNSGALDCSLFSEWFP